MLAANDAPKVQKSTATVVAAGGTAAFALLTLGVWAIVRRCLAAQKRRVLRERALSSIAERRSKGHQGSRYAKPPNQEEGDCEEDESEVESAASFGDGDEDEAESIIFRGALRAMGSRESLKSLDTLDDGADDGSDVSVRRGGERRSSGRPKRPKAQSGAVLD